VRILVRLKAAAGAVCYLAECTRTTADEKQADGVRDGVKNAEAAYPVGGPLIVNQCVVQCGRRRGTVPEQEGGLDQIREHIELLVVRNGCVGCRQSTHEVCGVSEMVRRARSFRWMFSTRGWRAVGRQKRTVGHKVTRKDDVGPHDEGGQVGSC